MQETRPAGTMNGINFGMEMLQELAATASYATEGFPGYAGEVLVDA